MWALSGLQSILMLTNLSDSYKIGNNIYSTLTTSSTLFYIHIIKCQYLFRRRLFFDGTILAQYKQKDTYMQTKINLVCYTHTSAENKNVSVTNQFHICSEMEENTHVQEGTFLTETRHPLTPLFIYNKVWLQCLTVVANYVWDNDTFIINAFFLICIKCIILHRACVQEGTFLTENIYTIVDFSPKKL